MGCCFTNFWVQVGLVLHLKLARQKLRFRISKAPCLRGLRSLQSLRFWAYGSGLMTSGVKHKIYGFFEGSNLQGGLSGYAAHEGTKIQ